MAEHNKQDRKQHSNQAGSGLVIAAHGRHYLVQATIEGKSLKLQCVTRGKKSDVAVGDRVQLKLTSPNQGVIEAIDERRSLLYRSDQYKSKLLAANVTQLFIVVATEPGFADDLISRALVAAEAAGVTAHIVLNKTDIVEALEKTRQRLHMYAALGYPVHEVSARAFPEQTCATLAPLLAGQSTILIGQSGMGKSSLINLIVPDADIAVREISAALDTGKHTTTFTRLYEMDMADTSLDGHPANIIDSPGFQEFGLYQLSEGMLERAFVEFSPYLGKCKFYNCHHLIEPSCAVLEAVKENKIAAMRHQLYVQLLHESSQKLY
ncbi:ribosome small subunit-dependent GTPase A [Collimonas fungivorans]|uniref:Small ribosomal subunit biogenesis GTPase RsgA n=1 Tax=Collimonas fungivorans (strain Ter331) TaxID=1005048 RepID=G0ACU9_COLFT|nr:ribosome small subunit-dependent GTPase A [Collimonas fungivorans]AEK63054.1 Ribosome small subunit-stimulated GTPase EngC [Collimonas fungivorans Ter331]